MLSRHRKDRILQKLAEGPTTLQTIGVKLPSNTPEITDRRPTLAGLLHSRFGNLSMGESGPAWQRQLPISTGLSLTSERPVDLSLPSTYGARYRTDGGSSVALQYPLGGVPRATLETELGGGNLRASLQGKPTEGQYNLDANYVLPLKIPNIEDPKLELSGNVGAGPSIPTQYGGNVTFSGRF